MAKKICDNCGAPLDPSYAFCLNCGAKVDEKPMPQDGFRQKQESAFSAGPVQSQSPYSEGQPIATDGFCRECGSKVRAGWLYCMQCGTVLMPNKGGVGVPGGSSNVLTPPYDVETPPYDVETPPYVYTPDVPDNNVFTYKKNIADDPIGTGAGFDDVITSVYVEDPDDVTMVYGNERASYTLVRMSSGERYELNLPTTVGRGSKAEVRISGNPYIGRIHVEVFERDGTVFIKDKRAANHTYVNGRMIDPEVATKIVGGDTVSLAKEEFKFEVD